VIALEYYFSKALTEGTDGMLDELDDTLHELYQEMVGMEVETEAEVEDAKTPVNVSVEVAFELVAAPPYETFKTDVGIPASDDKKYTRFLHTLPDSRLPIVSAASDTEKRPRSVRNPEGDLTELFEFMEEYNLVLPPPPLYNELESINEFNFCGGIGSSNFLGASRSIEEDLVQYEQVDSMPGISQPSFFHYTAYSSLSFLSSRAEPIIRRFPAYSRSASS
jgi:hypothetical protein